MVAGDCFCKARVKHNLVEERKIAVHAQFEHFFMVGHYARARGFRTRAGKGGHGNLVGRGIFDQIPALVIRGLAGIGQQISHALAGIHCGAAAKGQQGAGLAAIEKMFYLFGIFVNTFASGLLAGIDENAHIPFEDVQPFDQRMVSKEMVDKPDCRAVRVGFAHGAHQIKKLVRGIRANHVISNIFCIAVHGNLSYFPFVIIRDVLQIGKHAASTSAVFRYPQNHN